MGAAISRQNPPLPEIIKQVRDEQDYAMVVYSGFEGVGLSTAAKAVAKAAKEHDLFRPIILVTAEGKGISRRKLQGRIAEELRIFPAGHGNDHDDDDDGDYDSKVARMIYESLEGRRFLLIVDKLLAADSPWNFELMGVPVTPWRGKSKILIAAPTKEVEKLLGWGARRYQVRLTLKEETGSDNLMYLRVAHDDLLEHFRLEACNVASALNTGGNNPQVSVDEVFHCFLYLCLFQDDRRVIPKMELTKYYIGEGLITLDGDGKGMDVGTAFRVGEALLEQLVRHRMVEEFSRESYPVNYARWYWLPKESSYLKRHLHIESLGPPLRESHADSRWIAWTNDKVRTPQPRQRNPPPPPPIFCPQLSTLLLNHNPQLKEIPHDFFKQTPNLRVLDLSRTAISSLPPSFSCLVNLRLLNLQQCPSLNILPPTLKHLKQLLILDVGGTPLSNIPEESFDSMHNLRLIHLSCANADIHSLPPTISSLRNLQQLLLSDCRSLKSILAPTLSLMSLTSLQKLELKECYELEEAMLPQLRQVSTLEELHISTCGALKDVEDFCLEGMPRLRTISLCNITQIARLSLRSCGSLELVRLDGLTNLKSLDLSGTKIKHFPNGIGEMRRLEHFDLTNVRYLEIVDWDKIGWLPKELKWDQCSCWVEEQGENRDDVIRISVSNLNIFRGLDFDSQLWSSCFSKVHFYISPCSKQHEKKAKKAMPLAYADVHYKMSSSAAGSSSTSRKNFNRHLEIEGVDRGRSGNIQGVVKRAEVLSLRENGFVRSLSSLGLKSNEGPKDCRVERCPNMLSLYEAPSRFYSETNETNPLETLWMSDLKSLGVLLPVGRTAAFVNLKHLHIECCPKLKKLFGEDTSFRQLETVDIKFCARLECLVEGLSSTGGRGDASPKLQTLQLWELPQLENVCGGSLSSLQKLRVRACPKLQHLPRLNPTVSIEGEPDWRSNLRWERERKQ